MESVEDKKVKKITYETVDYGGEYNNCFYCYGLGKTEDDCYCIWCCGTGVNMNEN